MHARPSSSASLRPHGEERRVSDASRTMGRPIARLILRDARLRRAPQDEATKLHAAGAAGAAAGALAASSALALRSLRGTAFCGLLRGVRLATPAASRKRITRSDGCAPFFIQACTL